MLSPQIVDANHPIPHLLNKEIYVVANLKQGNKTMLGVVPVPQYISDVLFLPGHDIRYIRMEKVIMEYLELVFDKYQVSDKNYICVTRNADIAPNDELMADNEDFRYVMQETLHKRRRMAVVRLEAANPLGKEMEKFLCEKFHITPECIFRTKMPMKLGFIFTIADKVPESMKRALTDSPFIPQPSSMLSEGSVMEQVKKKDVLLSYPYESMEPFLQLIKEASKIAAQQAEAKKNEPRKEMGFISVSIGEGIGEIFKGLGVDYLIEGGQTMNPSTEDMLNAIDQVNADHIFILPNNKNIILAANQAKALCKDKDIIVIPTKTVPQGITAMINYMPDSSAEENEARMSEEIGNVKTGQVTYAVRDTHIDDKEIKEGDIMGIGDHAILSVGQDVAETTLAMFAELIDEDSELISIYYGADVQEADAQKLGEALGEKYPDCDVEVHFGGQPIYYYVVSVE